MNRTLLILATLTACGVILAQTDARITQVQKRLKAEGFYLGNPTGLLDDETRAALRHYQVRHGLAVTGKLDASTAKELNATAPKTEPTPQPLIGSWRRLPSGEMQFVQQPSSPTPAPPAPARSGAASSLPPAPPPAEGPASTPFATETPLVPTAPVPAQPTQPRGGVSGGNIVNLESLRDFVEAYVEAGLARPAGSEVKFFAERVDYFGTANVPREQIRRDLVRYNEKWPHRTFWIDGDLQIQQQQSSNEIKLLFPLRYELRNGSRHASGKVLKSLTLLKAPNNDMQIVAVDEWKAP